MNRIYQGRVSSMEVASGNEDHPWKPCPDWENALWHHHELFQDAVNYYILALSSLAEPGHVENRLIGDLRERVRAAWEVFPRPVGGDSRGLRQSVGKWLGLSGGASLEDAFASILAGNNEPPGLRTLALALVLDSCGGEAAVQQGGRAYWPRFCHAATKPTYDFSPVSQRAAAGKTRLAQILHGGSSQDELAEIAAEMDLSWVAKLQPGAFFTHEESLARLSEAVAHVRRLLLTGTPIRAGDVAARFPDFEEQLDSFKAKAATWEKIEIPRNRKASKDLTFSALAFKFFPCPLTGAVLSLFIAKPKAASKGTDAPSLDFARYGDDPIKLARGSRGFVFRAFTALPSWSPASPGEPEWKEFDIAAFKEALKSLNQFNQKTQERISDEKNLRGQIAIMLGSPVPGWKPRKTEADEDEPAPEPLDPALFQLARELERDLTRELADTLVGDLNSEQFGGALYQYRDGEWQISTAALRGYDDIAEEWNRLHKEPGPALTPSRLRDVVKRYQGEEKSKRSIGSVPLFLKLCETAYWPLWLAEGGGIEETPSNGGFLAGMVLFHSTIRDFQRSREPINLTPAEPTHSRRLYMFSDLQDKEARVSFGRSEGGFTAECAIAIRADGGNWRRQRVRLFYSARRLLRDELQGGVESHWLQPMTRALGLKMPEEREDREFKSALSLMPDFASSGGAPATPGCRFLLNFPVDLDPSWIRSGLGKAVLWNRQFNGTKGKNLHLHWPGTAKLKPDQTPWWKAPRIIERGFKCLSIDLGQRTAGAWALLHVACSDPRKQQAGTMRPVREIGCDGERTWFAEVQSTGVLRLPGEEQKVLGADGALKTETFGRSGRKALESEWEAGKELAKALYAEEPEAWLGHEVGEKSFPEQNDALIALANRRLTRLNTFHRWSCFDPDRPEAAPRRSSLIERLAEELEHWRDPDVASWKTYVECGDFAAFRAAAGAAFGGLRRTLGGLLLGLANRAAPLRHRSWNWDGSKADAGQGLYGQLVDTGPQLTPEPTRLRGQRGLSLSRIEQLENLRRLFLRYNRSFDREAGTPAKFGRADLGRRSGEPCRLLLAKIERMKEQRVNQTAHLILAQALGVRLREHQFGAAAREAGDIHGEYEGIPGREPVDFIAIENLDRYLTSQGRAPSENSRLMKWAHGKVREKIKMLAEEPFGLPVVEAAAAYSSRFCAVTAAAGARCEERAELPPFLRQSLERRAERSQKPGEAGPEVFRVLLEQFDELDQLNRKLRDARRGQGRAGAAPHTLFLPKQGGPLFLPVHGGLPGASGRVPLQADTNAAVNIGLRAIAAPDALSILHRVRVERDDGVLKPLAKNAREKAAFGLRPVIALRGEPSAKLAQARAANFFFDAGASGGFDSAEINLAGGAVRLISGIGLWTRVNQAFPAEIAQINRRRLDEWKRRLTEDDNLPM